MDLNLELDNTNDAVRSQEFKLIRELLKLEDYFTGKFRKSSELMSPEEAHALKRELIGAGIIDKKKIDRWYALNTINRHLDEHDVIPLSFLEYCLTQHLSSNVPLVELSERYGISETLLGSVIRKALTEGLIDPALTESQTSNECLIRLLKNGHQPRELKYQAVAAYKAKTKSRKEVAYEFSVDLATLHRWIHKYGNSNEVADILRTLKIQESDNSAKRSEMSDEQKKEIVREYFLRDVQLDVILERRNISRRSIGRIVKELLERNIITEACISEWMSQRIKLAKRSIKKGDPK